jgi:hypothetical protein
MSWSQAFLWLALIILIIFLGFRIINNGKNSDTKTTTDAQTDTTAESNAPDLGSAPPEGDLPPDGGGPPM